MISGIKNNQKEVILKEILRVVKKYNIKSVLDIGSGYSIIPQELSKRAEKYVAIDSDSKKFINLKTSGIRAIKGKFPKINLNEQYDLVISSHSIPENSNLYNSFFKESWKLIKPGGVFLLVTFKGGNDDTVKLANKFRKKWIDKDSVKYRKVVNTLSKLGKIEKREIKSNSVSYDLNSMVNFLTFLIGGTLKERSVYKPQLEKIVFKKYKHSSKYLFIHTHKVLVIRKPAKIENH